MNCISSVAVAAQGERRGSARSQLFMLVRAGDGSAPLWAWDISLGGMQCKSKRARWPGTFVDLSFTLPGSNQRLEIGAQVVSLDVGNDGVAVLGLRFCRLAPGAKLALYRFIDGRRGLWAGEEPVQDILARRHPRLAHLFRRERPFAALLAEAEMRMAS